MKYKANLMWSIFTSSVGGFLEKYKSKKSRPIFTAYSIISRILIFLSYSALIQGVVIHTVRVIYKKMSVIGNKSMLS